MGFFTIVFLRYSHKFFTAFSLLVFEVGDDDINDFFFVFVVNAPDRAGRKGIGLAVFFELVIFHVLYRSEVELASFYFIIKALAQGAEDDQRLVTDDTELVFAPTGRFLFFPPNTVCYSAWRKWLVEWPAALVDSFESAGTHLHSDLFEDGVFTKRTLYPAGLIVEVSPGFVIALDVDADESLFVAHVFFPVSSVSGCAMISSSFSMMSLFAFCDSVPRFLSSQSRKFPILSPVNSVFCKLALISGVIVSGLVIPRFFACRRLIGMAVQRQL